MRKYKPGYGIEGDSVYKEHGPFYCPNGTTWDEMNSIIQSSRDTGNKVKVMKTPIKENAVNRNTHEMWYYARSKLHS
jgi:hypothetical protein